VSWKPSFCALCTDEATDLVRRPLGRGDALVWICHDCDDQPAHEIRGPERSYPIPEGPRVSILPAAAAGANRVAPQLNQFNQPRNETCRSATPGHIVVRVSRYGEGGRPIDGDEAQRSLRGQPWFSELRRLGSDARFHLFERPDAEAATRARRPDRRPIDDLERYRAVDVEGSRDAVDPRPLTRGIDRSSAMRKVRP